MNLASIIVLTTLLPVALHAAEKQMAGGPNIVVIMADDMGYSDPGCFGGEIPTPALNRLAEEGVRLTRFQNAGMCVTSRASMLTGKWWPRAIPEFAKTPLLSEQLQKNGYRTALIGKWHLRGDPMDRGFDHFFGFLDGFADHFSGSKNYRLNRKPFNDFGPEYYSSDAFTDRAIQFVETPPAGQKDQPFFLFLSFQAPHNPLQAPREDILKHRGRYQGGWQTVREARFKRQKEMGIVPPNTVLPDFPQNLLDWDSLTPAQRNLEDLRMAVYAAMIERMDRGIGRLMKSLAESGKADNTLVLFMSDNGADSFSVMDQPLLKQGKLPGDPKSNWQPGTGWAYASVTPWRLYKISQHSGGVTTGAIAWWPGGKIGKPGRVEHAPVHLVDLLPTFLEVSGSPASVGNHAGESILPLLRGHSWKRRDPLFFQYLDNRAIRTTRWTLAEVDESGWELFDTTTDPLETKNIANIRPELVEALAARWQQWWLAESGKVSYAPESSRDNIHYKPQGDRGSGTRYQPSAMPANLSDRYPSP